MALLPILHYPDPRLRTVARPVLAFDERLSRLIADMFETMYAAPGIGLAATQVNVHEQVIVMDLTEDRSEPLVFVNPEILFKSETVKSYQEGCLSVPGLYDDVERPDVIRVRAQGPDGQVFERQADGLLSVCIQHEMDHLSGKVFVDYLSRLKQTRVRDRLLKEQREQRRSMSAASVG
ncbi:MAG: peptide deformylase [Betaproteobacteria bacterium]|nr:peptide deformylase [Betaproteobacteria bacterium]